MASMMVTGGSSETYMRDPQANVWISWPCLDVVRDETTNNRRELDFPKGTTREKRTCHREPLLGVS